MPSSITEQHHNNGYQVAKHRQNHVSEKVNESQFASSTQQKFSGNVYDAYANDAENNFSEKLHQSHHANANQSSFNDPPRNSILGRVLSQRQVCQYYPQGRCRFGEL